MPLIFKYSVFTYNPYLIQKSETSPCTNSCKVFPKIVLSLIFRTLGYTSMSIASNLWQQISKGDKEVYAMVYRDLFSRFYNHGRKFTQDTLLIEDAAQEALLLLWERREKLYEIKNIETYYYSVYRNKLFAAIREQQSLTSEDELPETPEFSIESVIIDAEGKTLRSAELEAALKLLTSRQLEAIFLRFYEGFTYEEVAEMLDITVKATYKIVARALAQLKENMLSQLILCF